MKEKEESEKGYKKKIARSLINREKSTNKREERGPTGGSFYKCDLT